MLDSNQGLIKENEDYIFCNSLIIIKNDGYLCFILMFIKVNYIEIE